MNATPVDNDQLPPSDNADSHTFVQGQTLFDNLNSPPVAQDKVQPNDMSSHPVADGQLAPHDNVSSILVSNALSPSGNGSTPALSRDQDPPNNVSCDAEQTRIDGNNGKHMTTENNMKTSSIIRARGDGSFFFRASMVNTPYSRYGHDEQKARLGRQMCARKYVNRDVRSLLLHVPVT